MCLYIFLLFFHIEKIKNNLRDIEPQNGKKFRRTQAELKKGCLLKKKCKGTWARAEEEAVKLSRWRFLGLSFKPDYSTGDTEMIRRHNFRVWEDQLDVPMVPWLSTIIWYPRLSLHLEKKTSIAFALFSLKQFHDISR